MSRPATVLALTMILAFTQPASAQSDSPAAAPATRPSSKTILLTIFLKHDQSKTLDEINAHPDKTGFGKAFPPAGTKVVSWYVMMGVGQVVTLELPPDKLRPVNRVLERTA